MAFRSAFFSEQSRTMFFNQPALPHHLIEWYTYVKCSHVLYQRLGTKEWFGSYSCGMFSPGEDYSGFVFSFIARP